MKDQPDIFESSLYKSVVQKPLDLLLLLHLKPIKEGLKCIIDLYVIIASCKQSERRCLDSPPVIYKKIHNNKSPASTLASVPARHPMVLTGDLCDAKTEVVPFLVAYQTQRISPILSGLGQVVVLSNLFFLLSTRLFYDTRPDSYSIMASSSTLSAQELEILSSKAIAAKASAYCKSVRFSQNKDGMNVISAKMENYCAEFLHIIDICIDIYINIQHCN